MSESSQSPRNHERVTDEPGNDRASPSQADDDGRPGLELVMVQYDGRPDRGTIRPPDLTGIERMETWLSVDMTVITDLSSWR